MREVGSYTQLADLYDEIVVDPTYPRWAHYLNSLWSGDEQVVRDVLDVCCGTGLMAKELQILGYDVVGVDASQAMLDRAASALGSAQGLHLATLPQLGVAGPFDAAISTFDGLNYLSPTDLASSLIAVAAALRPGGWFIFDLHTDEMMRFTAANPIVEGEQGGYSFRIVSDVDQAKRTCASQISVGGPLEAGSFRETHHQYVHSEDSVSKYLTGAGFADVVTSEEYSSDPVSATTLRATWVARHQ